MALFEILVFLAIGFVLGWIAHDRIKIIYTKPKKKEDDTDSRKRCP